MDQTIVSTQWTTHPGANQTTMSNPPLSRFVHCVNDPLLDETTMGNPCLNRAITFTSTHCVHVATTATTTKSPMNWSLSLSLSLSLSHVILIFVSFCVYIWRFSIIIFVWILRKCEKPDKNVFSRAFLRTQPNTIKYFIKHFLECNQTTENVFIFEKYFHLKIFSRKIFYMLPNATLVCWFFLTQ